MSPLDVVDELLCEEADLEAKSCLAGMLAPVEESICSTTGVETPLREHVVDLSAEGIVGVVHLGRRLECCRSWST